MTNKHRVELSQGEISMLVTVLRMGGWHRKGEYPKNLKKSDSKYVRKMSKIMKKLEHHLEDDDE